MVVVTLFVLVHRCLDRPQEPRINIYKRNPEQTLYTDLGHILLQSEESYAAMRWCCEVGVTGYYVGRWDNSKKKCVFGGPNGALWRGGFVKCVTSEYGENRTYIHDEEADRFVPINPYDFTEVKQKWIPPSDRGSPSDGG